MSIRRQGGHDAESWTFDGWFLRPAFDRSGSLIFDGGDLLDYYGRDRLHRWQFDGSVITLHPDPTVLWCLEDGVLTCPRQPAKGRWRFDGLALRQDVELRPDCWIATAEVPVLVMLYVAGLLA